MGSLKEYTFKNNLANGDEYRVKATHRLSENNLYVVETRITHNSRYVGYLAALVVDADVILSEPMLYEIGIACKRAGGFGNFKKQVHLNRNDRAAIIIDVKLSEKAILSGVAEALFNNIAGYLRRMGHEFNRIIYLNTRLARPRCKNKELESIHNRLLKEHQDFTTIVEKADGENTSGTVISFLSNFMIKDSPDKKMKVIVSTIKSNNCMEIITRLFVNETLTGYMYAIQGLSERLAGYEVLEPFLDHLNGMDKHTPIFCIIADAFKYRFVKSGAFLSVSGQMLKMMLSSCPESDESILVRCCESNAINREVKSDLREEVEKYWCHPLLW